MLLFLKKLKSLQSQNKFVSPNLCWTSVGFRLAWEILKDWSDRLSVVLGMKENQEARSVWGEIVDYCKDRMKILKPAEDVSFSSSVGLVHEDFCVSAFIRKWKNCAIHI